MKFTISVTIDNVHELSNQYVFSPPTFIKGTFWKLGVRRQFREFRSIIIGGFINGCPAGTICTTEGLFSIVLKSFDVFKDDKRLKPDRYSSVGSFLKKSPSDEPELLEANEHYEWRQSLSSSSFKISDLSNKTNRHLIEGGKIIIEANVNIKDICLAYVQPKFDFESAAKCAGFDLILVTETNKYHVSSQVISMNSPLLAKEISKQLKSAGRPMKLALKHVPFINELLQVLYGCNLSRDVNINLELYKLARSWQMFNVMHKIETWLLVSQKIPVEQKTLIAFRDDMTVVKNRLSNILTKDDKRKMCDLQEYRSLNDKVKQEIWDYLIRE